MEEKPFFCHWQPSKKFYNAYLAEYSKARLLANYKARVIRSGELKVLYPTKCSIVWTAPIWLVWVFAKWSTVDNLLVCQWQIKMFSLHKNLLTLHHLIIDNLFISDLFLLAEILNGIKSTKSHLRNVKTIVSIST